MKLISDEQQFNLGFETAYKCDTPELLAYQEGVMDGAKAQLAADKKEMKELFEELEENKFAEAQHIPEYGKEKVILCLTENDIADLKAKYLGE